jgi:hypothetical protein
MDSTCISHTKDSTYFGGNGCRACKELKGDEVKEISKNCARREILSYNCRLSDA